MSGTDCIATVKQYNGTEGSQAGQHQQCCRDGVCGSLKEHTSIAPQLQQHPNIAITLRHRLIGNSGTFFTTY